MSYIGNQPSQVAFLTDQFSGNGSTTAFTMSVAPANTASVLVAVSGVLQDPSTYAVSGTTLTFTGAPPAGTGNISVRYLGIPASGVTTTAYRTVTEFSATAGQTTFTPPSYTAGFINVYRNGIRLASNDYTATNGTTVVLSVGANLYDTITVESYYVSSVLNAIPATAGAVTQTYLGSVYPTGSPTFGAYQITNQTVTAGSWQTVQLGGKYFDTNTNFNTSTYRFTPTIPGYYQLNGSATLTGSATSGGCQIGLYYNLNTIYRGNRLPCVSSQDLGMTVSTILYFNGTTDFVVLSVFNFSGVTLSTDSSNCYLTGTLVRGA